MLTRWTPESEKERLFALQSTRLLDTAASEDFDRITRLASRLFNVPIALITLVDAQRQWFKSAVGTDLQETPRADSFCQHTIRDQEVMVIEDAMSDSRFRTNPLVLGAPNIRFYAGAPLIVQSGHALGSLCIIDTSPRTFGEDDRRQLKDVASMVMAQVDLHRAVGRVDEVTGLPNRSQLVADLEDLCVLEPSAFRSLVLVEVLSHRSLLKMGNALGVPHVDQLLRDSAETIMAMAGRKATVYHVGLARFAWLMSSSDQDAEENLVCALLARLRQPVNSSGLEFDLHPQAGITTFSLTSDEVRDAVRKAMVAVQQAGQRGASVERYQTDEDAVQQRSYRLLRDLTAGLANGDLRLVYQPKFNARAFACRSVEALLRWEHPQLGSVAPAEFIPLLESTTLIHTITAYVLDAALRQAAVWRQDGLQILVAVNVSSRNLEHDGFVESLRATCLHHGVPLNLLQVECTESAALTGVATIRALQEIRAMGIKVAIDDFGAGYSNLASLQNLPAHILKIDRSMIRDIDTNQRALSVLKAIISMAESLDYWLIAEGVERAEVFDLLVALGCDEIQGYYFSRPLEAHAVGKFITQRLNALKHST